MLHVLNNLSSVDCYYGNQYFTFVLNEGKENTNLFEKMLHSLVFSTIASVEDPFLL